MDVAIDLRTGLLKQPSQGSCKIIPETRYQADLGEYHTFGIQMEAPGGTYIIHDVSVCKMTAEAIAECLNDYHVSPMHLYDVVTDALP